MSNNTGVYLVLGLIIGGAIGFGVILVRYEPKITDLQNEVAGLQDDYEILIDDYSALDDDYGSLMTDYTKLETGYNSLEGEFNDLKNEYNILQSLYNTLSYKYDDAVYYIDLVTDEIDDCVEVYDSYTSLEGSFSRIFKSDSVDDVQNIVWDITKGSDDFWDSVESMYEWVDENIVYCYDLNIPVLYPTGSVTFDGHKSYTSLSTYEFGDYKQTQSFTLEYRQGDCDDQAALIYSMIKYYMQNILDVNYRLYLMRTTIGTRSGHVSVLLPVSGSKCCIIDPVGDDYKSWVSLFIGQGRGYLTGHGVFGGISGELAYQELLSYSNRYSSMGGITYIKLYSIDITDGSYYLDAEGTISQIASFLGG